MIGCLGFTVMLSVIDKGRGNALALWTVAGSRSMSDISMAHKDDDDENQNKMHEE